MKINKIESLKYSAKLGDFVLRAHYINNFKLIFAQT
jgi:hypothetical protein